MRNCNCNRQNNNNMISNMNINPFPKNYMYGHCYTPNQRSCSLFTPQAGLRNGSMFPELVSPYFPGQSMEEIEYLRYYNNENGGCRNV